MRLTEQQQQIISIIKKRGEATFEDFAEINQVQTAINAHLRRLIKFEQIYICRWEVSNVIGEKPVYRIGNLPSVSRADAREHLKAQRKALREREQAALNGVQNFDPENPRPDVAAAWMFNPPRGDAQGVQHD
jgi:hypothetical protein